MLHMARPRERQVLLKPQPASGEAEMRHGDRELSALPFAAPRGRLVPGSASQDPMLLRQTPTSRPFPKHML